jgi:hypothetical protein
MNCGDGESPGGVSYVMVGESVMKQFAALVKELTGRRSDDEYQALGHALHQILHLSES